MFGLFVSKKVKRINKKTTSRTLITILSLDPDYIREFTHSFPFSCYNLWLCYDSEGSGPLATDGRPHVEKGKLANAVSNYLPSYGYDPVYDTM